jgi:hypothetical protein
MGEGGAVHAAVDPAGLLAQLLVGAPEGGHILLLQQGVLLGEAAQVLQQLLGIHLKDLHGLEKLWRELELLAQLGF